MYAIYERTAYSETVIGRFLNKEAALASLNIAHMDHDEENDAVDVFTADGRVLAIEKVKGA